MFSPRPFLQPFCDSILTVPRLLSWRVIVPALLYLAISAGYVHFTAGFARYEVAADGKGTLGLWDNLAYFTTALTPMMYWGTTILAVLGVTWSLILRRRFPIGLFFLSWLIGYASFKVVMPTSCELRHFFGAMPALAGLAACLFADVPGKNAWKCYVVSVVIVLAIGLNVLNALHFPRGLVGYGAVGRCLASLDQPGNILLCCWEDQDLIFRYRASSSHLQRAMLRGDRLLVVRLPEYARVKTIQLVTSKQEMLNVIRRGRARYLVTGYSTDPAYNDKFPEITFAHDIARSSNEGFRFVKQFPLLIQYGGLGRNCGIFVWEYLGDLPDGPSELEVRIPTAKMSLIPTF
jgi:hypothetical protein